MLWQRWVKKLRSDISDIQVTELGAEIRCEQISGLDILVFENVCVSVKLLGK